MKIEVGVYCGWVPVVLWEPKTFRQEHEGTREDVVDVSMPHPEAAIFIILWVVSRLAAMYMPIDNVEQVAYYDSTSKRGVWCPFKCFAQYRRIDLLA